jgi:hypothetical protein
MATIKVAPDLALLVFTGSRLQVNALQGSYKPGGLYCINNVTSVTSIGNSSFYTHALDKFTLSAEGYLINGGVNLAIEGYIARYKFTTGAVTYLLDTIRNNEVFGSTSVGLFPFNKTNITNCVVSGGSSLDYTTGSIDQCIARNGSIVNVGALTASKTIWDNSDMDFTGSTGTISDTTFISQNTHLLSGTVISIQRSKIDNSTININGSTSFTCTDAVLEKMSLYNSSGSAVSIIASTVSANCLIELAGCSLLLIRSLMYGASSLNDFSGGGSMTVDSSYLDGSGKIYQASTGSTILQSSTLVSNSSFTNNTSGQALVFGCNVSANSQVEATGTGTVPANMQYCFVTGGSWLRNSLGTSGSLGFNTLYNCSVLGGSRLWKTGTGALRQVVSMGGSQVTVACSSGSSVTDSMFSSGYVGTLTVSGINQKLQGSSQAFSTALASVTGTGARNF